MYARAPPLSSATEAQLAAQQQHGAAAIPTAASEEAVSAPPPPPPNHQWRQPPPPPEMPVQSPWRRSACDRCRAQKLRCLRSKEDDTSIPCTRCLRVRHPCFTSSAKPPGRSSGRLPPASELTAAASRSAGNKRAARQRASERVSPVAPGQQSPMSMEWPLLYQEGDQSEEAAVFEEGVMNMISFDENQPIDFFRYLASMPPCISASPPYGFDLVREGLDHEHEDAMDLVQEDQIPMASLAPAPPIQHCRGVLLARLLESLSTQLVQLNSESWDLGVLSVTSSTVDSGEVDVAAAEALARDVPVFNPLLSILVSTSKFLDICKLFVAPEASGGAGEASAATSAAAEVVTQAVPRARLFSTHEIGDSRPSFSSPSSLSGSTRVASSSSSSPPKGTESCSSSPRMPTGQVAITASQLLTLVSCYLQVVTIYNDIFSHLLAQLAQPQPPPPSSSSTQHQVSAVPVPSGANANASTFGGTLMTPSLVLAGFSVPLSSSLRMRLLVEVVEHQFEQIEHTLGLPGPYRVSTASHPGPQSQQRKNGTDGGGGLLARREAPTLLDAVIGLSSKVDDADSNDCGGIGVVASLRENLRKAQRVRRGGG
ncbi:Zn(2)-C6 fungal-type DNA-binding domain protein [Cordyceps fumosorosea ARSEF 2679]|uniref:Zn(2)-C6 fungal-type DNA-binding domain protein n=1 Tax=Cordyceps fumosorosea (strain ARSEF 2679) TaxID=1081104 RepID=A0A168B951_CORFA|nr:Zn(2)-C6 fungal-type DNA-binding domain protein [Cordyceps fumosorosea ARSEF 2679]OAA69791.1 Zn(2)-C6 fungal-type DNA-binding domain protein [Cordyceps fumosorosea ARSEF 2679]